MTSSPDVCPGGCLLNIVVVEHLRFALPGDTDPNGKLFAVLQDAKVISFTTCGSQVQPCLAIRYWCACLIIQKRCTWQDLTFNTGLCFLQDPVWQALALQDLSFFSQQGPSELWRRTAIFSDVSGNAWKIPVQFCLTEVPLSYPQIASYSLPAVVQTCQLFEVIMKLLCYWCSRWTKWQSGWQQYCRRQGQSRGRLDQSHMQHRSGMCIPHPQR